MIGRLDNALKEIDKTHDSSKLDVPDNLTSGSQSLNKAARGRFKMSRHSSSIKPDLQKPSSSTNFERIDSPVKKD